MQLTNYKRTTIGGCHEDQDRIGCVNPCRMKLGDEWHEPETLLCLNVTWDGEDGYQTTFAEHPHGWNNAPCLGGWARIVDADGNPPYPAWSTT